MTLKETVEALEAQGMSGRLEDLAYDLTTLVERIETLEAVVEAALADHKQPRRWPWQK
jgi:hypothetical protein